MRVLSISICILLLGTVFVPSVMATEEVNSVIEIDLEPYHSDSNSTIVNMMDKTTMSLEQTKILNVLSDYEGKYCGPYLESSLFEFAHEGGYIFFHTNFTFGPEIIMNGVSTFWVRVPVIPYQYSVWHLFCNWGYYTAIEGIRQPDLTFGLLLPWEDHDLCYGLDYNSGSGNVWSTGAGETYQIRYDNTGIYVEYKGIFPAGEQFMMAFWGILNDAEKPTIYLTQERTDPDVNQTFRFYEPYELRDDSDALLPMN